MSQDYQRELDFAVSLLKRIRLPVHVVRRDDPFPVPVDGPHRLLGVENAYENACRVASRWSEQRTVYRIVDQFRCHYMYFYLPGEDDLVAVVIGPYLTADMTQEILRELAESMKLPMHIIPGLMSYFMTLPVFRDPGGLMALISTLGEVLWGSGEFDIVEVKDAPQLRLPDALPEHVLIEQENILHQMEQMERRYAFEDALMEIVSKGQTSRADIIMEHVSLANFELRNMDRLRSMKNYCIVCNTLLRKAAQQGGVHPIRLDEMSGRFARLIEDIPTPERCFALIGEMIREYCQLVRSGAGKQYSAIIRKVILYIDGNISGDLSLTTLAQLMEVTPSYLSARFHRETGCSLARYITQLRMKTALQILKTTQLQIQSVAQLCGFSDPNYFGKQFKRFHGITPQQYRRSQGSFPAGSP